MSDMDEDAVLSDVEGEEETHQEGGTEDEKVYLPEWWEKYNLDSEVFPAIDVTLSSSVLPHDVAVNKAPTIP